MIIRNSYIWSPLPNPTCLNSWMSKNTMQSVKGKEAPPHAHTKLTSTLPHGILASSGSCDVRNPWSNLQAETSADKANAGPALENDKEVP